MPWKVRYSDEGNAQRYWEPYRMPTWPDEIMDDAIFLYRTRQDADDGADTGGSGFLVGVPWGLNPDKTHIYAVTNYHVAIASCASVIRLNTKAGKSACIETGPEEWFWAEGRDVAVHRIEGYKHFRADSIWDYKFKNFDEVELTEAVREKYDFGIGDEIFTIGRFIDLQGRQRNEPVYRTGVLSMSKPIPVPRGSEVPWREEPSYLVEMRSRTGFSGSPVYIYIDRLASRMRDPEDEVGMWTIRGPWLLGVQWGQLPIKWPDAVDEGFGAGMVVVVPCSALSDLLLRDERVVKERREYEARWVPA